MRIRRLNDAGLQRMGEFLDALSSDDPLPYPEMILRAPETSDPLSVHIDVDRKEFARRFEAAAYLYEKFYSSDLRHPERDAGLWAWLALFWFEQLCLSNNRGHREPGERARWIPELGDPRRYYRHLLLSPYLIYRAHASRPQRALALLCQTLPTVGHILYQLASRANLITCPAVVEAATILYYDRATGGLKSGSQTYGKPGTVFRLADVLMQFDRTFDLHTLTASQLVAMLPKEFGRWRGNV